MQIRRSIKGVTTGKEIENGNESDVAQYLQGACPKAKTSPAVILRSSCRHMILPSRTEISGKIMMTGYMRRRIGRLRTMWPQLKKNPGQADAAEAALSRIKGVISVKASAFTGNVFIRYDAAYTGIDTLLESIQQAEQTCSSGRAPQSSIQRPTPRVSQASADKIGRILIGVLIKKCLERSAIALVAAVL